MRQTVEAIYERGVLRPLERLSLPDGRHVTILIEEEVPNPLHGSANYPDLLPLAGCLKDSPIFAGDPLTIGKALRDEWTC